MAFSKAFVLQGLLFAVLLILSKVSGRELAEAAQTQGSVEEANNWGHGYGHGRWGFGYGHGRRGFGHGHGHWGFGHGHGHRGHGHGHGHWGHGHEGIPRHNGAGGKVDFSILAYFLFIIFLLC
ncbi:hypothetical protein PVL29_025755 [Vitis rotundifolia]|uniref:Glycine-rich protein n=1 Tax=Vitis rotundifolia TaxID=103349 RepID=A0AA39D530_VITRO|nr:hypothetical protein PVL29_025755 [Vitis rotundifolia]